MDNRLLNVSMYQMLLTLMTKLGSCYTTFHVKLLEDAAKQLLGYIGTYLHCTLYAI